MQITDVQVNLCDNSEDRLRAYCAIVIDGCFVVHNIRVIEKADGLLVAMPSRKVTAKCRRCRFKNPVDASYCSNCGTHLPPDAAISLPGSEAKIHFDVAHPINANCRSRIETAVLAAYHAASQRVHEKAG